MRARTKKVKHTKAFRQSEKTKRKRKMLWDQSYKRNVVFKMTKFLDGAPNTFQINHFISEQNGTIVITRNYKLIMSFEANNFL